MLRDKLEAEWENFDITTARVSKMVPLRKTLHMLIMFKKISDILSVQKESISLF